MSGSAGEHILVHGHNISVACVPFRRDFISSEGMLYKDNPLSHSFNLLLFQIAMVNIFSQAMYFLLRPLRQSKFVCSTLVRVSSFLFFFPFCMFVFLIYNFPGWILIIDGLLKRVECFNRNKNVAIVKNKVWMFLRYSALKD